LAIVIVENLKIVIAEISRLVDAPNEVGDAHAVNPFPGKDPMGRALSMRSSTSSV
jgi:hypothetical protein